MLSEKTIQEVGRTSDFETRRPSSTPEISVIPDKKVAQITKVNSLDEFSIASFSDEQIAYLLKKLGYDNYEDLTDIPPEIEYLGSKIGQLSVEDAIEIMKKGVDYHENDPLIPTKEYEEFVRFSKGVIDMDNEKDVFELKALAGLLEYHSPYPEVRAAVDPRDDTSIPVETFRSYFLAFCWAIIGSGFNEFFAHRLVTISLGTSVIQMFLYPCGTLWAKYMPCWGFNLRGRRIALNIETPWTDKEQMFATLLFAICMGTFYTHYNLSLIHI